jgi:hypothetical protein
MASVGAGTGHNDQMDGLDAEIAAMEAAVTGESQPPQVDPDMVAQGLDQPPTLPVEGDQQTVEAITNVDEYLAQQGGDPAAAGQQTLPPTGEEPQQLPGDQQLVGDGVTQTASGRRSWKTDYQELDNRYIKLRQASDHHKFESRQQIAGLQEELLAAKDQIDHLSTQLQGFKVASQKQNMASSFSQEDVDVLGESTINNVQTAISSAVESATGPMQVELLAMKRAERERLKQQAQTNRSVAYQSFEQRLQELVPDYPVINTNPEFIKWLGQNSPFSGAPRMTFLHQAEQSGDVERVAQFFVEFRQLISAPQQHLESSVVPIGGGGGGGAPSTQPPPQPPGPRVFSWTFINQFYDDDIAGKYRGREALRDQLDAEIDLALKTPGRVV